MPEDTDHAKIIKELRDIREMIRNMQVDQSKHHAEIRGMMDAVIRTIRPAE